MFKSYKTQAKIHSLGGGFAEVEIIDKPNAEKNFYIAKYHGVLYGAIYNLFVGCFYVDDVYGML